MRVKINTLLGYENVYGCYEVDECGNVFGSKGKLKPQNNGNGYLIVSLCDGNKSSSKLVHRIVALAFISNPNDLPEVNHKDENKKNPRWDNLEWCTKKYNNNYGTKVERGLNKRIEIGNIKTCYVYDYMLNFVGKFKSMYDAGQYLNTQLTRINTRTQNGYFVLDTKDINKVLDIKTNYRAVVVTDMDTKKKMYFSNNKEVGVCLGLATCTVQIAVTGRETILGKYKIKHLNYEKLIRKKGE